jgi:hypothetical protein
MRVERSLKDRPILVVDSRSHFFIYDLQDALVAAGADVLLAHGVERALAYIERFDFVACLVGTLAPEDYQRFVEALGGLPILQRIGDESVAAIITKLTHALT